MTTRRWVLLALAAAAILLLAARAIAQVYVEYQWFNAAGAGEVWRVRASATVVLRLVSGLVAALFVFANLYAVRHSVVSLVLPRRVANLEIGEEVPGRYLMVAVALLSVALGALLSLPQDDWTTFVLARSNARFGEFDPYFTTDLGFFVFWLPFERELYYWTLVGILIVTALVVFLYALTPSLRWDRGHLFVSGYVRRHLTVLAGVLLLLLAWSFRLDMYALLFHGSGIDGAFSYVDHKVLIPGNLILAIATLGAALVVVWAGWSGQGRLAAAAILGVILLALVVRQVAPVAADRLAEESDPALRERPYLNSRWGYTRRAYGVDQITVVDADSLVGFSSLSSAAFDVAVWDPPAVTRALEATRRREVAGSAFGWRDSPAGIVADVPERPLGAASDTGRVTFDVSHVLGAAADEHGGIVRVPSASPSGEEDALTPAVVFPGARGHVLVSDSVNRIVGSSLRSFSSRLAHALSLQNLGWASGELPAPRPVIVTHRDVRERVRSLIPFFAQSSVVSPVVLGDSLFWIVDLYSSSAFYPLSLRLHLAGDERSYFKHAATVVVDAATGEVYLVPDAKPDPLAEAWMNRFPSLLTKWSTLPPGLAAALPVASDGLRAQMVAFGRVGQRSDSDVLRHPPALDGADSALAGSEPFFLLPQGRAAAQSIILLDQADRVQGMMIGIGGTQRKTLWYQLPRPGPKWASILDRLHGVDSTNSGAAREGAVARGPVRAVPLRGEMAYVQPAYLWRAQGAPTLARVTLLVGDSVRTASTFAQLAGAPPGGPSMATPSQVEFRTRVDSLYGAMRDALRRGAWTDFGRAFDALGKLLSRGSSR